MKLVFKRKFAISDTKNSHIFLFHSKKHDIPLKFISVVEFLAGNKCAFSVSKKGPIPNESYYKHRIFASQIVVQNSSEIGWVISEISLISKTDCTDKETYLTHFTIQNSTELPAAVPYFMSPKLLCEYTRCINRKHLISHWQLRRPSPTYSNNNTLN